MVSKLWDRLRENRILSIGLVVVLLIVIYLSLSAFGDQRQVAADRANLQIATVEMGNLTATIGATGTVRANQSAQLFWETAGTVESVNIEIGDEVAQDERLASLKLSSLPQNVILAQSELKSAQDELENFYDSYGALGLADAAKALAEAQDVLEDAQRDYSYETTISPQVDIDQAFANMILARDKLDKVEDDYEPYADKPEDNLTRASLLSKLAQARREYNDTVRLYNSYSTPGSDTGIAIADADLALALAQFDESQEDYEKVLAGPSTQDTAAAEARVAAAEATLSQAYIDAPFAGIVTDAYPTTGDQVSSGLLAFQLDDLSRLLVDVEVSEVDINRVKVGQAATLSFDAIPEIDYAGEVVAVALAGNTEQGAVNFRVIVELLESDEAVRPGMTAAVTVVVTELENVLLVPNRAVRVLDGKRVVYVLKDNGEILPFTIELGASSESYSEILEGEFSQGDAIVLNPPTITFEPGGGPPPFVGGGGGFGD
jgi:HlyD family secretion protein